MEEYLHPELEEFIEQNYSQNLEKQEMDETSCKMWHDIVNRSNFALLTNKVTLLKHILNIVQHNEKCCNMVEFSSNKIHICNTDNTVIQVVDLDPNKMGKYHLPEERCTCTFQCSTLVKFFRQYVSDIVVCLSKPKDLNVLEVHVFENDQFASRMAATLEYENTVNYIDDSEWDSEPNMHIDMKKFCAVMKYSAAFSSSKLTGYAKHISIVSDDKLKMVNTSKVYGVEPPSVTVKNEETSQHWEKLIEKHMNKMHASQVNSIPSHRVTVLNHPIVETDANSKMVAQLGKIKPLSCNDQQMVSCYFKKSLPEINIKDGGITVGTYKVYILGASSTSDQITTKELMESY